MMFKNVYNMFDILKHIFVIYRRRKHFFFNLQATKDLFTTSTNFFRQLRSSVTSTCLSCHCTPKPFKFISIIISSLFSRKNYLFLVHEIVNIKTVIFLFRDDSIDIITIIKICFYYMISYYERNNFFKLSNVIINLMENLLF